MPNNRLLLLSCGISLAALSSHVMGMEVHLSEHWSDAVVITFSDTESEYSIFSLKDPSRVVVDVVGINESSDIVITGDDESSIVEKVRHGKQETGEHRYVFDISKEYEQRDIKWWSEEDHTKLVIEANPKGSCTPNAIDHDVCETASEISQAMASQLPIKMNKNIILEKAISHGNTVNVYASLSYNEEYLKKISRINGTSMKETKNGVSSTTKNRACSDKNGIKPFIELGGEVVYHYTYSDGSDYLIVSVNDCK